MPEIAVEGHIPHDPECLLAVTKGNFKNTRRDIMQTQATELGSWV